MLDRNKCSFYQKTSGKRHKLCLGQSKTSRRWKVNNGLETKSNQNEYCVNTTNSLPDPTLIFPLEEEETPKFSGNRFHETVSISSAQLDSKSILSTLPRKKDFLSKNIRQSVKIVCRQSSETRSNKEENSIDCPSEKKNVKRYKCESRREKILRKLTDTKMLHNLIEKLDEKKLTEDFLFAILGISSGYIPIDTIPHLAFLDSVRFKRFKMSCNMTYSQKMKKFWHCFYKVGGGPALRLLCGPKGTGDNNLDTESCSTNFAVPSLKIIKQVDNVTNKIINPGIFHDVLDNIAESTSNRNKEFILSFDRKSVGPGLREDTSGDVDLWDFEMEPNLNNAREHLETEYQVLSSISSDVTAKDFESVRNKLRSIIKMITLRIKDIREIIDKCKKQS